MVKREFTFPSADGKTAIHAVEWLPEGAPRAVLQIAHGVSEYVLRYEDFAGYLTERGFAVVGGVAAAVADYRPATVADDKIKKKEGDLSIPVERTEDILGTIGPRKTHQFLCGFSMETRDLVENSSAKLTKKNLDMVVANNLKVAGAGFGVDTNVVTFITPDGTRELPLMSKADVADAILDEILRRRAK